MVRGFVVCLGLMPVACFAQNELVGKDQFPEFRTMSGLPGSGVGILENGVASLAGAMSISTPIAHSLGARQFALGLSNTSLRGGLRFYKDRNGLADGSAWGSLGVGTKFGDFTVGGLVLSTLGDNVMNLHFTPRTNWDNVVVGVGVQDLFSTGGSSGETLDLANGGGDSRSFYLAGTVKLIEGAYATVGAGTRRFEGIFGSVSANLIRGIKGVVEYDTFNWNYAVAADLTSHKVADRTLTWSTSIGQIRGKYWTWSINVRF